MGKLISLGDMSRKKPLIQFCGIAKSDSSIEKAEAISLHASALAALQGFDATDQIEYRIASEMDALLDAHLGVCRTTGPDFNALQSHIANKTGFMQYYSRRDRAVLILSALLDHLEDGKVRLDGYTVGELMKTAEIGKDTWQKFCRKSGVVVEQGDSHRWFTNAEIRKLIAAAHQHGKRKGKAAADAWTALLERNQHNSDE